MNNAKTALSGMESELGKTNQSLDDGTKKQGLFAQASEKMGLNMGGIKTALGAAVGAYLGSAIKSAVDAQESTERLTGLLENQGLSANVAGSTIKSFTSAIKSMSAFSGGEAKEALQTLTEKGIDATKALGMEGLLADVAAGSNRSLSEAASLVADAYHGRARALVALGILTKDEVKQLGNSETASITMEKVQQRLNERFGAQRRGN